METKNIRNVVLLGHSSSGKTTLAETMLFESGMVSRRGDVESGNTVSDYTELEQEKQNSIFSTMMNLNWRESKINLLDTPGQDDFVGEVISSMRVADTALMVINSSSGVEVGTELLWEYIEEFKSPCVFVVNQVDHEKSDYWGSLEQMKGRFGNNVIPVQYPLNEGPGFNTIVDALRMTMYVFGPEGGKPEKVAIPDSELGKAQEMHNALVEAAAENDESLMEIFFEEGSLSEEQLAQGLHIALAKQEIFPVFCSSAIQNMGTGRIMGFIMDIAPSPAERSIAKLTNGEELECKVDGKPYLFIYKTVTEPRVGTVSYFKVYSGEVKVGDELMNLETDTTERFNQLFTSEGKNRAPVESIIAGDLGVTVKLRKSHTNNTLALKGSRHSLEPIVFPHPKIRTAIVPPSKADMEKLAKALTVIHEEDPTLIIEQSPELKQTLIHGQGQLHLDLIKHRIDKEYGLMMEFIRPRIPYRETITKMAQDSFRHKKQTGGAGQFGEVHMRIEPYFEGMPDPEALNTKNRDIVDLPWGGHLAFYWCIVGGSIDAKYSNAIKKGVMQKMEEGPQTGSPCRDIRVSVFDGKMHPVDSNDMAFQLAGTQAFKKCFQQAKPQVMEPIYDLEILCSGDVMGDVMSDLQSRRAIIMGMESEGHYQKIMARAPLSELHQYSSSLRSVTQGKAKFKMSYAEYQTVTPDIQKKLVSEYNEESSDD